MNNQGLLALAQLILPSEILTNFEVVRVEEESSLIRIYLDESVKAEYKENPEIVETFPHISSPTSFNVLA